MGDGPCAGGSWPDPRGRLRGSPGPRLSRMGCDHRGRVRLPRRGGEFSHSDSGTGCAAVLCAWGPHPSEPAATLPSPILSLMALVLRPGPPSWGGGSSSPEVSPPRLAGGAHALPAGFGSLLPGDLSPSGGVPGGWLGKVLLSPSHWAAVSPLPEDMVSFAVPPLGRCKFQAISGKEPPLQEIRTGTGPGQVVSPGPQGGGRRAEVSQSLLELLPGNCLFRESPRENRVT